MSRYSWHDFIYVTPEQALEKDIITGTTLEEYRALSKSDGECHCGEPIWRMVANLEMCFSCITGQTDASNDYELHPE